MEKPLETPEKRNSSKKYFLNNVYHKNSADKSAISTKASTYIGPYVNNQKNGQGKLIVPDQFIYKGNFKNDLFDGYGEYISKQYNYYGNYACGQKCGKGKEINLIKNIEYNGEFKDDKKEGFGKEKSSDGSIYIGEFKENKKHGEGTLILNGIKTWSYKGEFKNDKISGKGIFRWNKEKKYIGEWDNNEISGYGLLINKNTKHIGYFAHNNKQGYGASFYDSQFAILGNWEDDYLEGFAIIIPLVDLEQSNNIINNTNYYNNSNDYGDFPIVKTFKGEIIQKDFENNELNKFKSSQEYKDLIILYKNKIYSDFIQSNKRSNSEECESYVNNKNEID